MDTVHEVQPRHWRERTARVRRDVAYDEENAPVVDYALSAPEGRADLPETEVARVQAAPPDGITAILHTAAERVAVNRRKRLTKKRATVDDLQQVWQTAIRAKFSGYTPPAWSPKQRGLMKNRINAIDLPDPGQRWGLILDWVARDWGAAVSLSIPFMLRDMDKRDEVLDAHPAFSLFLHFAEHFVQAYTTIFHGAGMTPEDDERARMDRAKHDRMAIRLGEVHTVGYDRIARRNMRADELEDAVVRMAQTDEGAAAALSEREEHRALVRRFRQLYGSRYREELRNHINRERVRQGQMQNNNSDIMPTEDMSGYMGE